MTILDIETNFLWSIATGRDPNAEELLSNPRPSLRIVMPSVCYLEALSTLEVHRKHIHEFIRSLNKRNAEFGRDLVSANSKILCSSLTQSAVEVTDQFNNVEERLLRAVVTTSTLAEFIEPLPGIVQACVDRRIIANDLTDNLILHSICQHSRLAPDIAKVLLTGNTKDFGKEDVKEFLQDSGVSKLFSESKSLVGWLDSLPSTEGGGSVVTD